MIKKEKEDLIENQLEKGSTKPKFSMSGKIYNLFSFIGKSLGGDKSDSVENSLIDYEVPFLKNELKSFIDTLDIEDEELKEKIHYFVNKIFQSEDISKDILYIITIMRSILGREFINENMDSFAHVLESIFTCSRMPELFDIKEYLDNNFPGISQTEFMILTTLFHDLKKAYKPSQYLDPIDAIKGGHLSSHQWDGAKFVLEGIEDKKSDIYNYFKIFFVKKNIDISKISEFANIIARIISGHAGNTEFIQIDTARTLLNITNYIDNKFSNVENFTIFRNRSILFIEDLAKEKLVSVSEVDFLKNLKNKNSIIIYLKRLLIQKYIYRNIGREIGLLEINLDSLEKLCSHMDRHMNKEESLSKLLEDSSNAYMLEDIIEEKKELWRKLDKDINKYLHPTFVEDSIENKMRLLFNINDIQSYVVPSSASFRKLLYHNTIDRLLSSPINGAVDVLAQLQLGMERSDSSMEKGFYQAMYYNGIANLKELINSYHIQMKRILQEESPKQIKEMGVTCKDAYIRACNMNYQTPEELKIVKDFFVSRIDDLCDKLDTNIVYPSIKLEGHMLLCDGLGDLAYTETLDVFSKILVDESIDTIKITSNMTTNQKRILYNMLTNNYPLLEILRLTENSQVVNIKFTGFENITYELSIDFIYNILDTIKNILIGRFDDFYKTEKVKGRVVRNHYNNLTFSMPTGKPLEVLFSGENSKHNIIREALERKISYIEEYALKIGQTKEFIINTIINNLNFGIGNSFLATDIKEDDRIDAFYKADIMSRQEISKDHIEISVFSEGFIKNLVAKAKSLEAVLIGKYIDSKCTINNIEHDVVIISNGKKILNPILFRYIRKYSSKHKYSDVKIMNTIGIYIDLLDSCFEFISFFVREESPFKEVSDINDNFAEGLIKTKNITQNHKGTYARQSLLELTSNKGGLRMVINIDGMTVDNIDLFKVFSDKILDDNLKKSEFFVVGHDITVRFVEAVELIEDKYPESIISIGGYEKYIYIPNIDDIDSFIDFVSNALDSKNLKAKLSYNYCETVLDSKESYDRLIDSNRLVSYIEQFMEETIYELGLQDKIQIPNNIFLYIGDKELYLLDENIIKNGLTSIIKKTISYLSLGEDILELKDVIEIGDSKLDVTLTYKNNNMNIKIKTAEILA